MEKIKSVSELGTGSVWKLLLKYAIPSVIAMTAASLYNITDSIFIGHGVGALAISGLAITFPLMNLAAAFGSLVGIGAATLMSLRLGQKDYKTANKILGNVFVLNAIFGSVYTVVLLCFLDSILLFFGASPQTLPFASDYMTIITAGNIVTHMYFGLNALLRASGNPKKSMYATIYTVIINIVVTPLFIFVFEWGIKGAALATVLAQVVMLIWQIKHFTNSKNEIHLKKGVFKLEKKIVIDSLSIGIAPFLMNAVSSVIIIVFNQALIKNGGDLAVGAYGIINRMAALYFMVVMGLNQGMQPIAGYNFGAGRIDRVSLVLKQTIMLATAVMTMGFIISQLFPEAVARVFTSDRELIEIVVPGLKVIFLCFPVIGFQMVTSNFFQSIGHSGKAIFMSMTRQVVFLLPLLLILPHYFGVKGVWISIPIADSLSATVAAYMLLVQYRKIKNKSTLKSIES